jgi:hypothetical protein
MISRRSFAKLLGITPIAAKHAADKELAKLAGINMEGASSPATLGGIPAVEAGDAFLNRQMAAVQYMKQFGLPDFLDKSIRRSSKYVGQLDPDIVAKKSWSMSVKILTQRQRNYQNYIDSMEYQAMYSKGASLFKKLTGWDWPY